MTYNNNEFPKLMQTAGKITILTALMGVMVFVVAFIFDVGTQKLNSVSAATSTATTTLTVLNTPPTFTLNAYEVTESSTSSPTNSGDVVQWRAIATDSNAAPYFLLICKDSTWAPIPTNSTTTLGTARPRCSPSTTQWGVSTAAASGVAVTVSTTTTEAAGTDFSEVNNWFAWVCDDDPVLARCNTTPVQGYSATNSAPFHMNQRPILSSFSNNGPVNPGAALTFTTSSADPDSAGGQDNIFLTVCNTNSYNSTTDACNGTTIATTSGSVTDNATAIYNVASIMRDQSYPAYGFLRDQHGHEATANGTSSPFTVNNVAPTVLGGDIDLNGGNDIQLVVEADETTGFTFDFTLRDANSCVNTSGTPGTEFAAGAGGYDISIFRADLNSTSTCNAAGQYDPNDCYVEAVGLPTWNISCTASTTSCTGATDDTMDYSCTFPLWFVADPTDAAVNIPAAFSGDHWTAAVRGIDDDGAIGHFSTTSNPVELISFTALDLITAQIPYGALEPGTNTGTLSASTTVYSVGNTGLDQQVRGHSMCGTFAIGNECDPSATSTVPEDQQKFSSSSLSYASAAALTLSSTTFKEVELDVNKSTSTSTPNDGTTYFGIAVPMSITLAGSYTGQNTFVARTAEALNW